MSLSNAVGIYSKFITESMEVVVKKNITDVVGLAVEIFGNYLKKELINTSNTNLKSDIKRMDKIASELYRSNNVKDDKVTLNITVADFLIFKYGIETVEDLLLCFKVEKEIMKQYKEFLNVLNEKYDTLDIREVREYYEFISSMDRVERN